jgi:hypothetical protein
LAVPSTFIFSRNSVPNLGMGYSETNGIPRKEGFFPRNNESLVTRNFDGNPRDILLKNETRKDEGLGCGGILRRGCVTRRIFV